MTTPPPTERDTSGRFVKPEVEPPTHVANLRDMHPMSRLLFGWVDAPRTPVILLLLVIAIAVALVLIGMIAPSHGGFGITHITGFYGLWGFGAFSFAVLSGWPLGKLLRRSEDYYGEAETTPQDVETEQ